MAEIPESLDAVPAVEVSQRPTTATNAWLGEYRTVCLTAPIGAVRVHVGAGMAASTRPHLAGGAGIHGRWFAIGDIIQTYEQYRSSRALPADFTDIALATLDSGTVLNVGLCAGLFGLTGGGEQVEYLEGPKPVLTPLNAMWSHKSGRA